MTDTEAPGAAEPPERYLTLAEVQAVLGIKKTRMYELINAGEIERIDVSVNAPGRSRRVGEKAPRPSWRVPESQITAYVERNKVPVQ